MKLFIFLTFLPLFVSAQVDHWESVILPQDTWNYLVPTSEPLSTWKNLDFDDASWDLGESGIGYGDDDDNTIISPAISLYIRREFVVVDKAVVAQMVLHMDYDDGFVAYLNGTEFARATMAGAPPLFDQTSDGLHEASLYQGIAPEGFEISPEEISALLIEGNNVLAIQIHNFQISSSDLTAIPVLSLGVSDNSQNYQPVPSWF